jgi:hypothetical protein
MLDAVYASSSFVVVLRFHWEPSLWPKKGENFYGETNEGAFIPDGPRHRRSPMFVNGQGT